MGLDADDGRFADLRRLVAGADRAPEDDPPEGASAAELARLSDRLGRSLPPLLRSWLSICRGAAIGPGGVFGQRPDRPGLDMVSIRDLSPEWQSLGWLPVAGDGCGNYYVLTEGGTYACCTPDVEPCMGLRGEPCKHILVLLIGLVRAGELDPTTADRWVTAGAYSRRFRRCPTVAPSRRICRRGSPPQDRSLRDPRKPSGVR